MPISVFNTYYMAGMIQEIVLPQTFFHDRYFSTMPGTDIFAADKVLVEYRDGDRKMAPFVVRRAAACRTTFLYSKGEPVPALHPQARRVQGRAESPCPRPQARLPLPHTHCQREKKEAPAGASPRVAGASGKPLPALKARNPPFTCSRPSAPAQWPDPGASRWRAGPAP
ncbi:MAG: hypothetical protein EOM69_12395 [Clostridia bacterium]|nr:hypothetical protein [Clostridia bacterium]